MSNSFHFATTFGFGLFQGISQGRGAFYEVRFVFDLGENFGCCGIQEEYFRRILVRIRRMQGFFQEWQNLVVLLIGIFEDQNGLAAVGIQRMKRGSARRIR